MITASVMNPKLATRSFNKEDFNSFKDDFVPALEYSQEHSLQNNAIQLGGAAHIIWNDIFEKHWHYTRSFTDICQNELVSALQNHLFFS